jgi:hypothetical protein
MVYDTRKNRNAAPLSPVFSVPADWLPANKKIFPEFAPEWSASSPEEFCLNF